MAATISHRRAVNKFPGGPRSASLYLARPRGTIWRAIDDAAADNNNHWPARPHHSGPGRAGREIRATPGGPSQPASRQLGAADRLARRSNVAQADRKWSRGKRPTISGFCQSFQVFARHQASQQPINHVPRLALPLERPTSDRSQPSDGRAALGGPGQPVSQPIARALVCCKIKSHPNGHQAASHLAASFQPPRSVGEALEG